MRTADTKSRLEVLYLEDNSHDRRLVEETLRADGFDCSYTRARTKGEFLTALKTDRFDLILSDFTLPSFDGRAALDAAKTMQPESPFILVSGTVGEEQAVEFLKAGAADCVLKDKLVRLAAAVRRALREASERAGRKQAEEALRALAGRLQASREEERILISREIHDELGEALTAQKLGLSWLRTRLGTRDAASIPWDQVFAKIEALSSLADATARRVRKLCSDLRPSILDDLGLVAAIEWQTHEFQSRTGIRCGISCNLEIDSLANDRSVGLFRIFQELLTNVARHSSASRVRISLKKAKASLVLQVKDNGKGIADHQITSKTSLGILGMRERATLLGGELAISGKPGRGTVAMVTVPLNALVSKPAGP